MTARYCVGIDLGTSNCVVAFTPLDTDTPQPALLPIPQAVAPGQVESRFSLPSFLYIAPDREAASYALPDEPPTNWVVGEAARAKAAQAPGRVVSTAKSWLTHAGVDRRAAILPWQSPDDITKISPLDASAAYLRHLAKAWDRQHPDAPLADQVVVLTVPASFDPAARDLTREAALAAGLPNDLVLLEEPQAAVYRWLSSRGDQWRQSLKPGDSMLVLDVGGGTTDLTLVQLTEADGNVQLQRRAVGNHLLVGGDNMDLALAHFVAQRLESQGHRMDAWQNVALWHSCRAAKERLLAPAGDLAAASNDSSSGDGSQDLQTIAVLGRGSKLIGGTITTELRRGEVADLLLSGFFPICDADAVPARQPQSGFQDLGLPYESDPAVTRHIAAFLSHHASGGDQPSGDAVTHLLFNGGVFRSPMLRDRVRELMATWQGGQQPMVLAGADDLDHAVALGAAFYGWSKQRGGIRIRGGTARSYYIGIETAGLAIPGAPRPLRALCVAPQGMEEGSEADVPSQQVGVIVGQTAQFRFFSSTTRSDDQPGVSLDRWSADELVESEPIQTLLEGENIEQGSYLPVQFQARVTELGMFELYCLSPQLDQPWKLEFNAREDAQP